MNFLNKENIDWEALVEEIYYQRKNISWDILDNLDELKSDSELNIINFLKVIEELGKRWNILKEKEYSYRMLNYGSLEVRFK